MKKKYILNLKNLLIKFNAVLKVMACFIQAYTKSKISLMSQKKRLLLYEL